MTNSIDWDALRRVKWASVDAPSEWDKDVRPISTEGLSFLGIDGANQLYWDGRAVEFRKPLTLSGFQTFLAVIVAVFTVIGGIGSAAQGWTSYHDWACKTGRNPVIACTMLGSPKL